MQTTILQSLLNSTSRTGTATLHKFQGQWVPTSWSDKYLNIEKLAAAFIELGLSKGDRVSIIANTRKEWAELDLAIMGCGACVVPIYQTSTPEDIEFILKNCEPRFLILENKSALKLFKRVSQLPTSITHIFSIDEISDEESIFGSMQALLEMGESFRQKNSDVFRKNCEQTSLEDAATILYTSGTTGTPKGVLLTHQQIVSEVDEAFSYVGMSPNDLTLSFLPYAHILGRIESWGHMRIGYTMAFAESIEKVKNNLAEIKPTVIVAVPRIFEKIYAMIWSQAEASSIKNRIFRWSIAAGLKAGDARLKKEPLPLNLIAPYLLAQKLVLDKVKEAFGGRLRFAVCGGAPLARDIALFFHACNVLILEGYGLTETTAAICVNAPFNYRFGSVGQPIGEAQVKIAEDGEILVKSKKVMKEYYKNPEATAQVFTDGWFHTGDIGEIMSSGDIRITDRKKDLIKTAGGKYVAPQKLEGLLKTHSFISNVLIHGDQKKYIVALITLDKQWLVNFAKDQAIQYEDFAALTQHPKILEMVRTSVAEVNGHLASYESIKRFSILKDDFTVEAGELTPSLKVKRKFLDQKFSHQIEALYS